MCMWLIIPVNIIDPDGQKLVYLIRANDSTAIRLTYSKENFFYNDRRIYSASSGNYDKTTNTLLNQYRKILDSEYGTVTHEMRHQNDHEIGNTDDNELKNSAKDPSETGSLIMRMGLVKKKIFL